MKNYELKNYDIFFYTLIAKLFTKKILSNYFHVVTFLHKKIIKK